MQREEFKTPISIEMSEDGVLDELDRILSSDLFSRSPVLCSFLQFIVNQSIENTTGGIKEYTIAVSALGKPTDFNPQIDAIVRIHAGRLRRLLKEYYSGPGIADPVIIELIKGSYVPVFRMKGYHESLLNVDEEHKPFQYSRSKLRLAILPFRNLCPINEYQFFADGFGEELTRSFSYFQEIAVIAHHSTRKYMNAPDDVRSIGAALGAHYIIDGSIKRTPDEIRVSASLIETMNGLQIWSQTFNHQLNIEKLTTIQDDIVENICCILGGYYGLIIRENIRSYPEQMPSLSSFDAALWHHYRHMNFSKESFNQTLNALKLALKYDPDHAICMAMLAEMYLDSYMLGFRTAADPVKEGYVLAKRAISIDPRCQHAYLELAWAYILLKKKEEALDAMEFCLAINPSSVSFKGATGFVLACAGEYDRANVLLQEYFSLNQRCPWWFYFGFFLVKYNAGQYQKALECANKIEVADVFLGPLARALANYKLGLKNDALQESDLLSRKFPEIMANLHTYLDNYLLDKSLADKMVQAYIQVKASAT